MDESPASERKLIAGDPVTLPVRYLREDRWVPIGVPFADALAYCYQVRWTSFTGDEFGLVIDGQKSVETIIALPRDAPSRIQMKVKCNQETTFPDDVPACVLDLSTGSWKTYREFILLMK